MNRESHLIWEAYWDEGTYWQNDDIKVTINDVLKIADEPIQVDVNDLKHLIIKNKRDPERIKAADLRHPIVVSTQNGQYRKILDGQHRLVKAIQNKLPVIDVRVLNLDNAPEEYQQLFEMAAYNLQWHFKEAYSKYEWKHKNKKSRKRERPLYRIENRKPALVPPASKEEAKKLMMAQSSLNDPDVELHRDDEEWSTGTGSPEEFIDQMFTDPDDIWQHEAIHALQELKYPGWMDEITQAFGQIDLADRFDDSTWDQKAAYFSRPTEIMAFAFDVAANKPTKQQTLKDYKRLGELNPEAYKLFLQYVEDYS